MPRPTPSTSLPPVSWSRVAASSIIRIGWISGRIEISVPSLIVEVRWDAAASIRCGVAMPSGVLWCSAS